VRNFASSAFKKDLWRIKYLPASYPCSFDLLLLVSSDASQSRMFEDGPRDFFVILRGCFLFNADVARSGARTRWDTRENASGLGLRVALDLAGGSTDPAIGRPGVVNLASRLSGPVLSPDSSPAVAPGQIVSIQGQFGLLGSASMMLNNEGVASTSLVGARVYSTTFLRATYIRLGY
jgi:hypothetical protein